MLEIDIDHHQGDFHLNAVLVLGQGLTALFGPSGSGKTTIINAVAGLIRPEQGTIRFGGTLWSDAATGYFLPTHKRRIGYVFQEPRLFPHLSVKANLLYGRYFTPRDERRDTLKAVSDMLGLDPVLERSPNRLSGGEKQRVAIGRALMASPRLLLMDEPLSALDSALKAQILPYIERIRDEAGVPILYVSHAVEEVTRLANRVVMMKAGKAEMVEEGDHGLPFLPRMEESRPGTFLHARIIRQDEEDGLTIASFGADTLYLKYADLPLGTDIRLFVPAADLVLATGPLARVSTLNRLTGVVQWIAEIGKTVLVKVDCSGQTIEAEITRRSLQALDLVPGATVSVLFKAVSVDAAGVFRLTPPQS
ncbi:molybdenum ABC transporter ATP-binding protein [Rhizobium sp.]|jgi:molybdate transport system ATP-binding protein|uniref:molybdenum ABC transporter ATP-binding protein n=1 Tax=Rhizobium sp. TaxID=391 RepID=UPI002AA61739